MTQEQIADASGNQIAMLRRLSDVVDEYDQKVAGVPDAIASFEAAGAALKAASCVGGTWGDSSINTGSVYEQVITNSLLKSGWRHIYDGLNIKRIASADDKRRFAQAMANPAPFTLENIRATFGDFIANPRGNILRGLAEVFSSLDPAYKSHDKVKIGVSGLPKRVIISGFGSFSGYGKDRVENILNALAAYQGKPLVEWAELDAVTTNETALINPWEATDRGTVKKYPARGVRLRRFSNGNGHLFFEPETLRDINKALAEYYGEVLADCSDDTEPEKRQSTAVSKDLQYYPTPKAVVEWVIGDLHIEKGQRILEPSCGCGRFLDALRAKGANVLGIEVDPVRAAMCRDKGHNVLTANFLETVPTADFDRVVANPPFSGIHYAKHIRHALKFLKPGGVLTAILPITARYDHGLLDELISKQGRYSQPWNDLPVGSFSESGTNINTTVLTIHA